MTNTPVTQIIEELDKRIADLENARNMIGKGGVMLPFTAQINLMTQFREYALTMLPVEKEQKEKDYSEGCDYGINAPHPDTEYGFSEYFKSNYNQYAGDNTK